jgi:hypothetical protein
VGGEIVEWAIIGFRIDPPEPGTADVGNAWAELVAEQPKNAEDLLRCSRKTPFL